MNQLIDVSCLGPVATLTFNDPERRNAMTEAMGRALLAACNELATDSTIHAVVLTGAGRAFSAGGDLEMIEARARAGNADPGGPTRASNLSFMRSFYGLYLCVRELPVPAIAAINGAAVGAGLCVALACDLRIASRDARLGLNFARLGIHPGMGATWTLPRIVGPAAAAELLFTGRLIRGEEAARIGLVNRAVEPEEVLSQAVDLAREVAASAPQAVRGTKRALARSLETDLEDQLSFEAGEQALCYESADLLEGLAAVREKRSPHFSGK